MKNRLLALAVISASLCLAKTYASSEIIITIPTPEDVKLWNPPEGKILAQQIVDEVTAKHASTVLTIGLHCVPPVIKDNVIIASNTPTINVGLSSNQWLDVWPYTKKHDFYVTDNKTRKGVTAFEAYMRLYDKTGKLIGAVFFKIRDEKRELPELIAECQEMSKEISSKIPSEAALYTINGVPAPGTAH